MKISKVLFSAIILTSFSSCCDYITVKVVDKSGYPISGATQTPTPIIGKGISDSNGNLKMCKDWAFGVMAPNHKSFSKMKNNEYHQLDDGEVIVLEKISH